MSLQLPSLWAVRYWSALLWSVLQMFYSFQLTLTCAFPLLSSCLSSVWRSNLCFVPLSFLLTGNPLCYISVFSPLPRPSVGSSNAVSDAIIMRRSTTVPIWGSNPRRWRSRRQNNNIKYTPPLACSPLLLSLQAVKIFTCSRLCSSIHSKAGGVHYSMTANVGSDDHRWHHSSDTWDTRELISCKAFFTFVPVYISRKKNIIMTKKRQIYQILSIFLLYSSI